MAHITINDLPPAADLSPELEELIQGAGLKSFRPTLEALEDREVYAAHLGSALPPVLPQPPGAAVGATFVQQQALVNEAQLTQATAASGVAGSARHAAPDPALDAAVWATADSGPAANRVDAGLGAQQMGQQAAAGIVVNKDGTVTVNTADGYSVYRHVGGVWKLVFEGKKEWGDRWREDSFAEDGTRIRDIWRHRQHGAVGSTDHVSRTVIAGGKMTYICYHAAAHYMSSGLLWFSNDVQQTWVYSISADGRSQDLLTYELIPDGSAYYANRWTKGTGWNVYHGGDATVDGNPPTGQYLRELGDFLADKTVAAPPA